MDVTVGASCSVIGLPCSATSTLVELSTDARAALEAADTVVGSQRQLAIVNDLLPPGAHHVPIGGDLAGLDVGLTTSQTTVVLASGDPGFFGVLRQVRARCPRHVTVAVYPAVSSVQAVFAAAGLPWDDAVVLSAHGRNPRYAVNACRRLPKTAVLTSPEFGPGELVAALDRRPRDMWVGSRLGTTAAEVTKVRIPGPGSAGEWDRWPDPNVVVLVDAEAAPATKGWSAPPRRSPTAWGLEDGAFAHRDGQISKAEVRAQALAWLGPGLGDMVWDIGCGSGSVAVESARLGAAALALDRDADQVARTRANADAHAVPVDTHHGTAPAALANLPDPDVAFVGGGGTDLPTILAAVATRTHRVVVVALAALERVGPAWRALADAGLDVNGTQVAASRLAALPDGSHHLAAANPVILLRGHRG